MFMLLSNNKYTLNDVVPFKVKLATKDCKPSFAFNISATKKVRTFIVIPLLLDEIIVNIHGYVIIK